MQETFKHAVKRMAEKAVEGGKAAGNVFRLLARTFAELQEKAELLDLEDLRYTARPSQLITPFSSLQQFQRSWKSDFVSIYSVSSLRQDSKAARNINPVNQHSVAGKMVHG